MFTRILRPVFHKKLIRNYRKNCISRQGYALLYAKTDPFLYRSIVREYAHTNNWEFLEIARILNRLGFWVDIVDRTVSLGDIRFEDTYDVFIGIGAGNSGKYYPDIASQLKRAAKVFYAAGPEPTLSNELIYKRYAYFYERHPDKKVELRRTIDKVDIQRSMELTDAIFCIGNEFAINTYAKFAKPIYRICPSTSPRITTDLVCLEQKSPKKFLYFGGNGNIVKGLDLVIEVFAGLPDLELYICAPENEGDFNEAYKELLTQCPNIHFLGFIRIGGKVFNEITSQCGYIIFPSCSEGIATSVVTCMRRGLIPVVTRESGIDVRDFGYLIEDVRIEKLQALIQRISEVKGDELYRRSVQSYLNSFAYTQSRFSESFEKALIDVLVKKSTKKERIS